MAFPVSPIDGATATVNGIIYSYSATDNAWTRQLSPIANLTVTGVTVSNGNIVANANTASTSTVTGALVVRGGAGIAGNVYADKFYTTTGLYWAGNGVAFSSSSGGAGDVTVIDYGAVTDSVTESFDFGLVTDLEITTSYDYSLVADGVDGSTIVVDSIPGNRLLSGTNITVGNISAAGGTASTSTTTGTIVVTGGVGLSGNITAGGTITAGDNITAGGTITTGDTLTVQGSRIYQTNSGGDPYEIGPGSGTGESTVWGFYAPAGRSISLLAGATERIRLDTAGNVIITPTTTSTSTTTGALVVKGGTGIAGAVYVGGNVTILSNASISRSLGVGTTVAGNIGEIRATNYITAFYSDRRLKSNIEPITSALSKVKQLAGVLYTQNTLAEQYGYSDYGQQVGLFAQDVQQVLPQAVKPAPFDVGPGGTSISGQHFLTIQYEKMVPLLVEAIKELSDLVDQLKGQ